jgi:nitroimidazol reductase NimA-like FMN-containing flavoprotein (pyridoxamine 5'-phosphate oxidase superfamily)
MSKGAMIVFKELRRQDREISQVEAVDILANADYGVLSMNGGNDYAYGVPISYVYLDNSIYLHCALEGQKLSCLRNDNRVSFCVVGTANVLSDKFSMAYTSVIVFGTASEVNEEEKLTALFAFIDKYSRDFAEKGREYAVNAQQKCLVIKINVENVTGKSRKS